MTEQDDTNVVRLGRGKFFAVERRCWAAVCDLGSINAAVSYLVLASGTQGDHRTTSWSVNAVEKYTGVPRYLAKAAIDKLLTASLITQTQGGTRPRYVLAAASDIPTVLASGLTDEEGRILSIIGDRSRGQIWVPKVGRHDNKWRYGNPFQVALGLARKGLLEHMGDQNFRAAEPKDEDPDWIWMPRTCIEGAARETPPIELLRQSASLPVLRLFVDLYHAQSLARHGGVHWRQLRVSYDKQRVGQQGAYIVWGFIKKTPTTWRDIYFVAPHVDPSNVKAPAEQFWTALGLIIKTGLADYVGHVIEADTNEATILFPYATDNGEPEEQAIAAAAHEAGWKMLTGYQQQWADDNGALLVPLRAHTPNAVLVGLLRLRYQAGTEANAEWLQRKGTWLRLAVQFQQDAESANDFDGLQHQMDIK